MAFVNITEFRDLAVTGRGLPVQIGMWPALAQHRVAIGASTAASVAFHKETHFIRVHCDAICSVTVAGDPSAVAAHARMAANQTEYFGVKPGDKLAVITNT